MSPNNLLPNTLTLLYNHGMESSDKNPVGRPSELYEVLEKIKEYINGGWETVGDRVPQIAGAAIYCGKHKDSLYQYAKESQEFSDHLKVIMTFQENRLINKGLDGSYNPTITKMLLTKHGYSEKTEPSDPDEDEITSVTVSIKNAAKKPRD